jgi:hypothetical protein
LDLAEFERLLALTAKILIVPPQPDDEFGYWEARYHLEEMFTEGLLSSKMGAVSANPPSSSVLYCHFLAFALILMRPPVVVH